MIKTIIADDHPIFRESIASILAPFDNIEIIGSVENGKEVLQLLDQQPDTGLLILDLSMPKMNGLECLKAAKDINPDIKSLIITVYEEEYVIKELLEAGMDGILIKNAGKQDISDAVTTVLNGKKYEKYLDQLLSDKTALSKETKLTSREKEMLRLIAQGYSNNEVAEKMYISPETARTHRRNMLRKLNLNNTAKLVAFAKSSGILD